jgi:hypothetical protein
MKRRIIYVILFPTLMHTGLSLTPITPTPSSVGPKDKPVKRVMPRFSPFNPIIKFLTLKKVRSPKIIRLKEIEKNSNKQNWSKNSKSIR